MHQRMYRHEIEAEALRIKAEIEGLQMQLGIYEGKLEELRELWKTAEVDPFLATWGPGSVDPSVVRAECTRELYARAAAQADGFGDGAVPERFDTAQADRDADEAMRDLFVGPVTEEGMYALNGRVFKVVRGQSSGNLYAKELVDGSFVYAKGAIRELDSSMRMTLEQAKAYGRETGVCCNCGAVLTNPESIAAGIGPICAGRF